ncbi:hypothetical protein CEXT_720501 [Caerostris extrusa]|uniref:Uncharacterized protein n=1 Tax=Caerostris extrusa TaxID=172846 RepID=A0AAV4UXJ1_CAEEX|nr:hypothetical protein CEXT_720501 [Caerostris extrusa]
MGEKNVPATCREKKPGRFNHPISLICGAIGRHCVATGRMSRDQGMKMEARKLLTPSSPFSQRRRGWIFAFVNLTF